MLKILDKIRGIKYKFSHDNLWDFSLGALLALVALVLYINGLMIDKIILVFLPFMLSFFNEMINFSQGASFRFFEVLIRCIVGVLLYLIIQ